MEDAKQTKHLNMKDTKQTKHLNMEDTKQTKHLKHGRYKTRVRGEIAQSKRVHVLNVWFVFLS
jgi:hypothetical protein